MNRVSNCWLRIERRPKDSPEDAAWTTTYVNRSPDLTDSIYSQLALCLIRWGKAGDSVTIKAAHAGRDVRYTLIEPEAE